jgi:hypothetical protein
MPDRKEPKVEEPVWRQEKLTVVPSSWAYCEDTGGLVGHKVDVNGQPAGVDQFAAKQL